MTIKIWRVTFGEWRRVNVVANNVNDAIEKAISRGKKEGRLYSRIQDITSVDLDSEAD